MGALASTDLVHPAGTVGEHGSPSVDPEERFVVHGARWHVYVGLRDSLDEAGSHLRLTYLEGDLELMSPSSDHEQAKTLLGRLLEAWCADAGIDLFALGSTTLRDERVARGLEADESYCVGRHAPLPDLAIEVVLSAWRVEKLEVYRGLGVPEVWVFRDGRITVQRLHDDGYRPQIDSVLFPTLDLALLARFVVPGTSLAAAVRGYRQAQAGG